MKMRRTLLAMLLLNGAFVSISHADSTTGVERPAGELPDEPSQVIGGVADPSTLAMNPARKIGRIRMPELGLGEFKLGPAFGKTVGLGVKFKLAF